MIEADIDTIAAIATAAGPGGVGIVRLSGPRAIAIAADVLRRPAAALDRRVQLGWAHDATGARVDQVVAFAMRAPASFTGEDVAELQGHGGAHNLGKLLEVVVARGARVAEPGEFTRRAVANGKLDLVRAEALLEVIHAGSERAWRLAQSNLGGRLGERVAEIEQRAVRLLAEIEGWIDFPEEDLETQSASWISEELVALRASCAALSDGFRHGRAVTQGIAAALVGPVNAGKSSLLNALVGTERALVAAEPGTTRDWLEVSTVWDGIAVTLVDTAGHRETADPVERRGIALGEGRVASVDVVVVVNDGRSAWDGGERYGERAVVVRSKADLSGAAMAGAMSGDRSASGDGASAGAAAGAGGALATSATGAVATSAVTGAVATSAVTGAVATSAVTGAAGTSAVTGAAGTSAVTGAAGTSAVTKAVGTSAVTVAVATSAVTGAGALATSAVTGLGLDELRRRILDVAGVADREGGEHAIVTTARQQAMAASARDAFVAGGELWEARRPLELVAVELRQGSRALAQLRGVEVGDRVLDEVFARFCIGK